MTDREQEIRDREQTASPGPWGTRRDLDGTYTIQHGTYITLEAGFGSDGNVAVLAGDEETAYRNSEFITRARDDVRWLLDENARLREEAHLLTVAMAQRDAYVADAVRHALEDAADGVAMEREATDTNVAVYPRYDGKQRLALSVVESQISARAAAVASPVREEGEETPDTLPAWLYQRFGKTTSGVDWDELYETDQEYWAHHAAAVRRAVARGGFKTPARDQPKPETQLTARGLTPREAMLRLLGEAADTPERAAAYNEAADKERASAIADRERAADTVLDQRVAAALEQKPTA